MDIASLYRSLYENLRVIAELIELEYLLEDLFWDWVNFDLLFFVEP